MAQTVLTVALLRDFAQKIRDEMVRFEKIKSAMDTQLINGGFIWEDPVAHEFKVKYQEGLEPIKKKLIPAMDNYQQYLAELARRVEEEYGEKDSNNVNPVIFMAAGGAGAVAAGIIAGNLIQSNHPGPQPSVSITDNNYCFFKQSEWESWDIETKEKELNKISDALAADLNLENPPPIVFKNTLDGLVFVKDGKPEIILGGYNQNTGIIEINRDLFHGDPRLVAESINNKYKDVINPENLKDSYFTQYDPGFVIQTLGHEHRHAWQHQGTDVPVDLSENFKTENYIFPHLQEHPGCRNQHACTFEDYAYQPTEVDANRYGDKIQELFYLSQRNDFCA